MDIEDAIDRLWWATEESNRRLPLHIQRVRRLRRLRRTPAHTDEDGAEWEAQPATTRGRPATTPTRIRYSRRRARAKGSSALRCCASLARAHRAP